MSKQQLRILRVAPFIALLFLGLLAFAVARAVGFRQSAKDHPPQILVSTATASLATEVRGPVQNVRFTVYDSGIYPRRLRAKPGVVAIVLEDHTRRRPGLVVERETVTGGLLVGGITFLLNQARTRTEFRLDEGRYRLFDTNNPANRAELIVER